VNSLAEFVVDVVKGGRKSGARAPGRCRPMKKQQGVLELMPVDWNRQIRTKPHRLVKSKLSRVGIMLKGLSICRRGPPERPQTRRATTITSKETWGAGKRGAVFGVFSGETHFYRSCRRTMVGVSGERTKAIRAKTGKLKKHNGERTQKHLLPVAAQGGE